MNDISDNCSTPSISVIIPVYNEENALPRTLSALTKQDCLHEIIVVDGGSTDDTLSITEKYARVIRSDKGRAIQMNTGADAATGDILLFLHADSIPSPGTLASISRACTDKTVVGGCCRQRIDQSSLRFRFVEFSGTIRSHIFHVFFGDQGIFVRKKIFHEIDGYPMAPIMEDALFSKKLRLQGKVRVLPQLLYTSARRWEQQGFWKTTWINWKIATSNKQNLDIEKIFEWYPDVR